MTEKKASMAQKKPNWGKRVRERVGAVQERLHKFQKDAEKTLKDLAVRGRKSRKELDRLVAKLEKVGWRNGPIKFAGKAMSELASQLEALSREVKQLSSKLDGLAKGQVEKGEKPAGSKIKFGRKVRLD